MNNDQEKISYIIGRQIGGDFKQQGIEISFDTFSQGVRSAYLDEASELTNEEIDSIMTEFQAKMQKTAAQESGKDADKTISEGNFYLEENKKKEGVAVTASGLQYLRVANGTGATPVLTDYVEVHYEGCLIDGTIFDSSYKRNETTSFPVNGVIPGWTEALQLMKEGDVWELTIPSEIAYGAQGAGAVIAPNSVLRFKVELIKVL